MMYHNKCLKRYEKILTNFHFWQPRTESVDQQSLTWSSLIGKKYHHSGDPPPSPCL